MSYVERVSMAPRYAGAAINMMEGIERVFRGELSNIPRRYLDSAIRLLRIAHSPSGKRKELGIKSLEVLSSQGLVLDALADAMLAEGSNPQFKSFEEATDYFKEKVGKILFLTESLQNMRGLPEYFDEYKKLSKFYESLLKIAREQAHIQDFGPKEWKRGIRSPIKYAA